MLTDLPRDAARYLSVLAAQDIRADREAGRDRMADRHVPAWEALQPACAWDED